MNLEEEYKEEITALFRQWAGRVQGFLINMGCDRGLAEEITQDAFLATQRQWARVRLFNEPEYYVFKVARNQRSRQQKRHDCRAKDLHPDPCETLVGAADDVAQSVTDRAVVRQALSQLPSSQREAVILRYAEGLSEAATALIMQVSIGSVKRYASEGRARLRELLVRQGGIN
jgi:RNA polymerase sigma factor (sigma-70 family)